MNGNGVLGRINASRYSAPMAAPGSGTAYPSGGQGITVSAQAGAGGSANVQATAMVLVALAVVLVIANWQLR